MRPRLLAAHPDELDVEGVTTLVTKLQARVAELEAENERLHGMRRSRRGAVRAPTRAART